MSSTRHENRYAMLAGRASLAAVIARPLAGGIGVIGGGDERLLALE